MAISKTLNNPRGIPFDFVLERLSNLEIVIKPMFGCHALYLQNKIIFILRKKENFLLDNGVWIATSSDHHESLKKVFPSMRSIQLFRSDRSEWQILPEDALDFEESVMKACDLVLKNDKRIGKIPKLKKQK